MREKIALIIVSFVSLFLELSLIRWLPSHVFSVAFFSNVILIASFLGLGLGFLLSERKWELFHIFPWLLLVFTIAILLLENIQIVLPSNAQTWIWSYYQGNRLYTPTLKIPIVAVLGIVFSLVILVFIPLGQKIGKLMSGFNPLYGYTLNILGSLSGVVCFGLFSFFNAPAFVWFFIAGFLAVLILYKERIFITVLFIITVVTIIIGFNERDILWSPYYSIQLLKGEDKSLSVYVNQLFHQKAVNFDKDSAASEKYGFPYKWFNTGRVLIAGSGTGNDVYIALKAGARHIDAVEIDPVILNLGRKGHPQMPYDSDRVKVFTDDARSFMHKSLAGQYDMIVYGTLDSHATLSVTSSIRLDNYVYTEEALQESRRLLSDKGVIVLLFSVPTDWMAARLIDTARSVFGNEETRYVFTDPYLFNLMIFAGPGLKRAFLEHPDLSKVLLTPPAKSMIEIPRDDWPYLYLEKRGIPKLYLITLLMLIGISSAGIFTLSPLKAGKIDIFFLLLGCAFLLLETKSVTTLSLLFGSTWLVNAVVFSAILFLALAANWLVMKIRFKGTAWLFGALAIALIINYFFPIESLLKLGFFPKAAAASILAGLPIFFAGIIFAISFKSTKHIGSALGSNLLGAVLGGFLEYGSMAFGLNALYIVALVCYLSAWAYSARTLDYAWRL